MPPGIAHDITHAIVLSQLWAFRELAEVDLVHSLSAYDLIVLGAEQVDAAFLARIATTVRNRSRAVLAISMDRDPRHVAEALAAGVDDYVVSPYVPEELLARMRNLLTRVRERPDRRQGRPLIFDFPARAIIADLETLRFPRREWQVLLALLESEGQPVTARQLALDLWNNEERAPHVTTLIYRLRHRLERHPAPIITIRTHRGRGYAAHVRRAADVPPQGATAAARNLKHRRQGARVC
jgi:DNA-binding response OmpR family regulator